MKTIIKTSLLIFLLIFGISASAQRPRKRLTVDIHAGMNLAEMDIKDTRDIDDANKDGNMYKQAKIAIHIGFNVNYKFWGNMQVQSGFFVSKKGLKRHIYTETTDGFDTKTTYEKWYNATGNYVQVPLNLGYELYFSKLWAFNINAGVYAAYGYKGTTKSNNITITDPGIGDITTVVEPESEIESFAPDRWRRFDYGLNGSVGLIYDIYTFNVGYEYGLYNISYSNPELRNRNFQVSLGFRF